MLFGDQIVDLLERKDSYNAAEIKALRAELRWSQSKFAAALGVQVSTVQKWEGGRRHPVGMSVQALFNLERFAERRRLKHSIDQREAI